MHLELADGYGGLPETALMENNNNRESPYLFVPAGMIPGINDDTYVNEMMFDDLSNLEWNKIMAMLEPYQNQGMSLWPFSTKKGRKRRGERRQKRKDDKIKRIRVRKEGGTGMENIVKSIGGIFAPAAPADITTAGMPMTVFRPDEMMPTKRPLTAVEIAAAKAAAKKADKTWIQKNWMWLAGGGAAILIAGAMMRKKPARRRKR